MNVTMYQLGYTSGLSVGATQKERKIETDKRTNG